MTNDDNYLDEIFDNAFTNGQKSFNQVFKVTKTEFGQQVEPLMKSKILDTILNPGQTFLAESISLNGKPISEYFDKTLIGKIHVDSGVFHITGHLDTPSED